MNKIRYLVVLILIAGMTSALPVQASAVNLRAAPANSPNPLTFDIACDGGTVCRIQNSSLSDLDNNVIMFYQATPDTIRGELNGRISLELPDGSSHGYASFRSGSNTFALGMDSEGSLGRFMAYGTLTQTDPAGTNGDVVYHAAGTFIQYR